MLVLNFFLDNPDIIVSAEEIYQTLKQDSKDINLTTIYRNLDKLVEDKIIMVFASDDRKKSGYKYAGDDSKCRNHLHLQCINCGKIFHLDCYFMNNLDKHISEKHSFDIKCSNSIIYGICNECKKKKQV